MSKEVYSSDNAGHRMPPHPNMVNPVAASGLTKTITTAGTNYGLAVEGGETYRVIGTLAGATGTNDAVFFSITGTTATTANKEWAVPMGQLGIIKIPEGVTTLYMTSTVSLTVVYLAKLDNNPDGG